MKVHGTVQAAADVILTSPLQLDRSSLRTIRFGNRDGLDDIVGPGIRASPEAAAGVERVNKHLSWVKPRRLGSIHLIDGLKLIARPDLAALRGELHDAIQGLHGSMRKIRKLERRTNLGHSRVQGRSCVPGLARRGGRLIG